MQTIKLAIIALILAFALGVMLSLSNAVETTGETVQQFAPIPQATAAIALDRRQQEAQVTATYLAVLGSEIVSDTVNTHAIARQRERARLERAEAVENAVATGKQAIIVCSVLFVAVSSIGGGVWLGCRGVAAGMKHLGQARLPMTRHLLEGPHITESGTITHTVTGATWQIDTPQSASPEHARLISATYQAMPPGLLVDLVAALASGNATGAQRAQVRYLMDGRKENK